MRIAFTGQYKSITPFTWEEVPDFVILTGINGSGKSQLLELIQLAFTQREPMLREGLKVSGLAAQPDDVIRILINWNRLTDVGRIGVAALEADSQNIWNSFESWRNYDRERRTRDPNSALFREAVKQLGKAEKRIERREFLGALPVNFSDAPGQIFNDTFARTCLRYEMRCRDLRLDGHSPENARSICGKPPWTAVNETLSESGLAFRVTDPCDVAYADTFDCVLQDTSTGNIVRFGELSSGEQIIISLVFCLFNANNPTIFPKMLLLDEPDGHLHPKMVKQFIDVMQDTMVGKLGIKVLMTSHSPSTIALAPEESLFEIHGRPTHISKVSREEAIAALSEGLLIVKPGMRQVLVEDQDDKKFYDDTVNELIHFDKLSRDVPLVFVQSGRRSGGETSGGKKEVEKWVERLGGEGPNEIKGLVDRDDDGTTTPGVIVTSRCHMENYLVDPLVVYAALVSAKCAPELEGIEVRFGREFEMRKLTQEQLESMAHAMHERIRSKLGISEDESGEVEVAYANGARCRLPEWLFQRSGKDILGAYRNEFGQEALHLGTLRDAYRKTGFIPEDLQEVMAKIQSL